MEEITLKVTLQEANTLLQGLAELPAKFSYGLIDKVRKQAEEQAGDTQQPELVTGDE